MSGEKEKKEPVAEKSSKKAHNNRQSSVLAFSLVVIMLGILVFLVAILLILPLSSAFDDKLMEYYRLALSTLLGAFGAWIGAGAAYFFGKENLKESSESTERAMKIQQQSFRRPYGIEWIKDMTLTAMNPNFIFYFNSTKKKVIEKLNKYKGYWFVPVVDENTGVLKDIIHTQVFWSPDYDATMTINAIVSKMDKDEKLKELHGALFYVTVSSSDKISDVYDLINKQGAEVAIVVDEKGKATHCVTKTELRAVLKVPSNS